MLTNTVGRRTLNTYPLSQISTLLITCFIVLHAPGGVAVIAQSGAMVTSEGGRVEPVRAKIDEILAKGATGGELSAKLDAYQMTGVLEPGGRHFIYAVQGASRSLQFDHISQGDVIKCYRLDDGTNLIKMDGAGVTVDSRGDGEKWLNITHVVSRFDTPLFFEKRMQLQERLEWFRDELLTEGGEYYDAIRRGDCWITITEADNRYRLELHQKDTWYNPHVSLTIDAEGGLFLTEWQLNDGAANPAQWAYTHTVKNTYGEVVPGVKMLVAGEFHTTDTGTAAVDRQPSVSGSIRFTSIAFGDNITAPMEMKDLPIGAGSIVEDHRVTPPVVR